MRAPEPAILHGFATLSPERVFVVLAALFGLLFAATTPPLDMTEILPRDGYRLLAGYVGILGHLDVVLPRWLYVGYPLAAA